MCSCEGWLQYYSYVIALTYAQIFSVWHDIACARGQMVGDQSLPLEIVHLSPLGDHGKLFVILCMLGKLMIQVHPCDSIGDAMAWRGCSLCVNSVCTDFSHRWLAYVALYLANIDYCSHIMYSLWCEIRPWQIMVGVYYYSMIVSLKFSNYRLQTKLMPMISIVILTFFICKH